MLSASFSAVSWLHFFSCCTKLANISAAPSLCLMALHISSAAFFACKRVCYGMLRLLENIKKKSSGNHVELTETLCYNALVAHTHSCIRTPPGQSNSDLCFMFVELSFTNLWSHRNPLQRGACQIKDTWLHIEDLFTRKKLSFSNF